MDEVNYTTGEKIIKAILSNESLFGSVEKILKPINFLEDESPSNLQAIMKTIIAYREQYSSNKIPNIEELILYVESDINKPEEEVARIVSGLERIRLVESADAVRNINLWKDTIVEYVKQAMLHAMLHKGIEYIQGEGDDELAYRDFAEMTQDIASVSVSDTTEHDYVRDAEERFKWFNELEETNIKTNIDMLNKLGFGQKGSLSLYLAKTNLGKCWSPDTNFKVYTTTNKSKEIQRWLESRS